MSACKVVLCTVIYLLVGQLVELPVSAAEISSPFTVEPEMVRWARDAAGREEAPERILLRLAAAVGHRRGLGVRETELETGTAREVFESRRANCAGFAFLVSGLARSLGVEAVVVDVSDVVKSERRGGFAITHRHLAVGVEEGGRLRVVDRAGVLSPARHRFQVLEDRTALAIYHSNRGAELLLAGRLDEALAYLQQAVEVDSRFEPAQRNLRIAWQRAGAGRPGSSGTLHALCESWSLWAGTPFCAAARR
ncbi:MAG TPA: transglutaminase domain-containing protein [Thermoanaerobaculia bacterium]|nr:transglutaminase domain-containing protein [Thermoanaerobaculia bacterium]